MTFSLLDVVALIHASPEHQLPAGAEGTVVEVFTPDAYMVEFVDADGRTLALPTLASSSLQLVSRSHELAAE